MSNDDRRSDRPRRGGVDREPTGWQPSVGAAREPIGREQASRRKGTPPRRTRDVTGPPRPDLPADEEPQLPRGIVKEIERAIGNPSRSRDIALALSIGSAAIDEERPDVAVEVLAWAKAEAPRISAIREAYGVALYHLDDYAAALTELQAYRRLTGRTDQNHVIADCFRGLGRAVDQVAEVAEALVRDDTATIDRRTEAAIVWAAAVADQGDPAGGRAVLRRFIDRNDIGEGEHALRLRYLAADLAERVGDTDDARQGFASIAAIDPDRFDVAHRLGALDN